MANVSLATSCAGYSLHPGLNPELKMLHCTPETSEQNCRLPGSSKATDPCNKDPWLSSPSTPDHFETLSGGCCCRSLVCSVLRHTHTSPPNPEINPVEASCKAARVSSQVRWLILPTSHCRCFTDRQRAFGSWAVLPPKMDLRFVVQGHETEDR